MADIELVIKIPKGLKKDFESEQWTALSCMEMKDALMNGTPLPKGHGRLGDLDKLEKEMSNGIKAGLMIGGYEKYPNINNMDDCVECVKYADTIIDADKESD